MSSTPESVSFETDIKPLFRDKDQQSMSSRFDLRSYQDVSAHADAIVSTLRAGRMPCDGAWPSDRIDLFQRWMDLGKLP
jgi:hypothetical protein